MNEITILIIGIGIGYFWAIYRAENIKARFSITTVIDAGEFWKRMEDYRAQNAVPLCSSVPSVVKAVDGAPQ